MSHNADFDGGNSSETESQIVTWINELGFAGTQEKVIILKKLQEILIYQCPQLISKYLDNILLYSSDKNQESRKIVVSFIEETCKIQPVLLPQMVNQLRVLLMDQSIAVQKRVIQAANIVYKNALIWISTSRVIGADMESTWNVLNELKLQILNMVDSENEGIRTNSIKFLAGIVVLQTYVDETAEAIPGDFSLDDVPSTLKFASRKNLEDESMHIFDLLLKFHNSEHISGVNLMACMTALCDVAKTRPKFLPRVIQALEELHTTLPPTLSQSQVNSVRKHLKMQIFILIKHPSSNEMLPQLAHMLLDLGMTPQEVTKIIPREKRNKRLLDLKNPDFSAKRARIDSPQSNSQGSDKSDISTYIETVPEIMTDPLAQVTEKHLLDGLHNINSVINLVVETMNHLPEEMPVDFTKLYEPISKSGCVLQKPALAKLLIAIIKDEPTNAMAQEVAPVLPDLQEEQLQKVNLKNVLAKIASKKKVESAVSKLMEETRNDNILEAAREREILKNMDKEKVVYPATPSIPKLKQRVKTIKLQEVTRPLPKDVKEKLLIGAVERILNAERAALEGGQIHVREKVITTFAVSYGPQVRETILTFILDDIVSRVDLALSWLYEEYSFVQGFNRSLLNTGKFTDKSGVNYNNLICALITNVSELADPSQELLRESLLKRIYLEAPLITEDAILFLKHTCTEEGKTFLGLNLLRDLVIFQPPKATKYVAALLPLTIHENSSIREAAVERVLYLYRQNNESVKRAIDKHANLYLAFIALPEPPKDLFDYENGRPENAPVWTDDLYKVCLQLYLALLPFNEELLVDLCRAYSGASAEGKRCVLRLLEGPVHLLGPENPTLLAFIEECPKGAETLVTRVIHLLTEKSPPTRDLVNKVRELYVKRVSDVRFLIPVINGLTKQEVLAALPKLIKLNPIVVREVFNKLLGTQNDDNHPLPVTPAELLVALHMIDPAKAELKFVIKATSLCFAEKQAYTHDVLESVLQQLVEQPQLPVLLMRSVLQALTLHPSRLSPLVINILHVLISRQVWEQKVVWEGFVKCCQRLKPQSCGVLACLPPEPLRLALDSSPDLVVALEKALPSLPNALPHVPSVLADCIIAGRKVPQFMENSMDTSTDNMGFNEPLPPGME